MNTDRHRFRLIGVNLWLPVMIFLPLNVAVYLFFENVERQAYVFEHRVMKLALIKFFAQFLLSPGAEFLNLYHADFVSARLTRGDDVMFYFRFNFFFADAGLVAH